MSDESEKRITDYTQMVEDMQGVIALWRSRGMDGVTILARFFQMAVDSMEASGVTYDICVNVIQARYGKDNFLVPKAKA